MRMSPATPAACALALLTLPGCCSGFSDADAARLAAHHGTYVLAAEGPFAHCGASSITLHGTDDATLLALCDTLDHFASPTLLFVDATITDTSVDILNHLKGLQQVDLGNAPLSTAGRKRLKAKQINAIHAPAPEPPRYVRPTT